MVRNLITRSMFQRTMYNRNSFFIVYIYLHIQEIYCFDSWHHGRWSSTFYRLYENAIFSSASFTKTVSFSLFYCYTDNANSSDPALSSDYFLSRESPNCSDSSASNDGDHQHTPYYTPDVSTVKEEIRWGFMLHSYGFACMFFFLAFYSFFSILNLRWAHNLYLKHIHNLKTKVHKTLFVVYIPMIMILKKHFEWSTKKYYFTRVLKLYITVK